MPTPQKASLGEFYGGQSVVRCRGFLYSFFEGAYHNQLFIPCAQELLFKLGVLRELGLQYFVHLT